MVKAVVILASKDDVHALAVEKCLRELNVNVHVFCREDCFQRWNIGCVDDRVAIQADGLRYTEADIIAVYLRKDYLAEPLWVPSEGLTAEAIDFLAEQREIHVESSLRRLTRSCPFINSIDSNRRCQSKPLQHHVARQCGLNVPRTYIGSDPIEAERFARNLWHGGRQCCTKNLESTHVLIDGKKHSRLTKLFVDTNLPELSGLSVCPMIFQEYVEKRYEYRVTVVGEETFTCRIDSQAAGGKTAVDWRHYRIPSTPHHSTHLDSGLNGKLVQLVKELGLVYGAIDLVENEEGDFFFLEINSMGQWLWIEDLTGLPISMAIARRLAAPNQIRR
jgi:glutathione synthase/RimK-type ligase-like ATP-grasp enzyme